ncbi:Mediator of RNA polymerase II transcription subunit 15, partial [Bos mutus]
EDAMRKAGVAHSKSSKDMESHVFLKAKTRDEYLSLVARLIIHFRDIHNKKSQASVSAEAEVRSAAGITGRPRAEGARGWRPGSPGLHAGSTGTTPQPARVPQDTRGQKAVSTAVCQGRSARQTQGWSHKPLGVLVPQVQSRQQSQGGFPGREVNTQACLLSLTTVSDLSDHPSQDTRSKWEKQQLPHKGHKLMGLLILPQMQQQQLQRMAQLQLQQQQQQPALQAQAAILPPLRHPPPPPSQALPQQLQPPQHHQAPPQPPPQSQPQPLVSQAPALPGQMLYTQPQLKLVRAPMVVQQPQVQPQVPPQTAVPTAQASQIVGPGVQVRALRPGSGGISQCPSPVDSGLLAGSGRSRGPLAPQPVSRHGLASSCLPPTAAQEGVDSAGVPWPCPPPPQPSPQPGPPSSQPNSNVSSGPAPSPSSFLPSPSPQPSQSPVTARTPQNFSVPSPGPLNTPVNPSSVMSPAGSSQAEEQQYLDKLKQLSKYIEPLRRMINKIDKNEDRKKDLSKMKSLLDILTDPSKRCPLKTLQKCEIALEKLKNDMAVPTPPPPPVPPTKQQSLGQPLLDAVLANIRSPVFNHSLYRTFVPAMTAIHGPPITAPVVSTRKRKFEEDERQTIPNVLQGEVARLDPKFLVNLDPSHCSNSGAVHLICKLDDKDLPSVPPLELSVPADYPAQSPLWINRQWQYDANPFLQSVHQCMTSRLLQLPDKHSVTALLNTWAQSVHQACLSAA